MTEIIAICIIKKSALLYGKKRIFDEVQLDVIVK